jgi:acyl carrier protein
MNKLIEIIQGVMKSNSLGAKQITDETNLRSDLGFDSFGLAELTVHIEDEFGIDIFQDGLIETVGEIKNKLKIS